MLRKARLRIFMHECQEQYFFFLEIFNLLMSMTIFPPYIAGLSNNLEPAEGLKIWEGSQLYKIYFALVWPNLTNLTPLSPNFDPGGTVRQALGEVLSLELHQYKTAMVLSTILIKNKLFLHYKMVFNEILNHNLYLFVLTLS